MTTSYHNPFPNPFKELRTKLGISQYELARRTSISKHAILRLEQGMYPNPLPVVLNYFVEQFPKRYPSPSSLVSEYEDFQIKTRAHNSRILGNIIEELKTCPPNVHPFVYLRESRGLNPTEVAKRLCVAQQKIVYFEKRSIHQHSVPKELVEALWDADYTEQETDALSEAYATYRAGLSDSRNLRLVTNGE